MENERVEVIPHLASALKELEKEHHRLVSEKSEMQKRLQTIDTDISDVTDYIKDIHSRSKKRKNEQISNEQIITNSITDYFRRQEMRNDVPRNDTPVEMVLQTGKGGGSASETELDESVSEEDDISSGTDETSSTVSEDLTEGLEESQPITESPKSPEQPQKKVKSTDVTVDVDKDAYNKFWNNVNLIIVSAKPSRLGIELSTAGIEVKFRCVRVSNDEVQMIHEDVNGDELFKLAFKKGLFEIDGYEIAIEGEYKFHYANTLLAGALTSRVSHMMDKAGPATVAKKIGKLRKAFE